MTKSFFFVIFLASWLTSAAQVNECGSMRKTAGKRVDSLLLSQRTQGTLATTPYIIKLYVVIFAADNGNSPATDAENVKRQVSNMAAFYAPHNICFILSAITQVNNTAMLSFNADEDEDLLQPYLRSGHITIFVHDLLSDNDGSLNGSAYGIPNNYLSISSEAIESTNNISTLTHEMGHCFGLYHTFEDAFGVENRARSGSCSDCEDDGDYLCDTNADRNLSETVITAGSCNYTGSRTDDCGDALLMEPENIMTYGRRSCRSRFTSGQGNRAREFIVTESILTEAIALDNNSVTLGFNYTSGVLIFVARNSFTFQSSSFTSTGSARLNSSAKSIIVKPGTIFRPTSSTGYAELRVNPFCN